MDIESIDDKFLILKKIKQSRNKKMMLSRTRKQIKNIQNFYKEAGLDQEFSNIYDKNIGHETKCKKDRMLLKKKNKLESASNASTNIINDKLQSDGSQESLKDQLAIPNILHGQPSIQSPLLLHKIINKISILQIIDSKTVNGCYGHTTVIFKKPVVEGQYYLEFKILKPIFNETMAKIKNPPSLRIGICSIDYPKNTPLGQDTSLGYKMSNGKLVHGGIQYQGGEPFTEGDVIGLGLKFSPPHKYQKKDAYWQQSEIWITKNGKLINKSNKIKQIFYCPAFSLFNYESVEVRYEKNTIQYLPQGFKPYSVIFSQEVSYEHLKKTAQFSFPIFND